MVSQHFCDVECHASHASYLAPTVDCYRKEILKLYSSMMVLEQTLLLVLLSEGVCMAPVRMKGDTVCVKDLDHILKETLLKSITNLDIIKRDFNISSDAVKVCGKITYHIICDYNCCSSTDHNITWATIDPTTLSGRLLYEFALFNWTVPWFEWEGACDMKTSLLLNLTSLPNFCYNDSVIRASLPHLTQHMPSFADSSETARLYDLPENDDYGSGWVVYTTFGIAIFLSFVVLVTIHSQVTTVTKKRKPKAYFQCLGFHLFSLVLLSYTLHLNNVSLNSPLAFTSGLMVGAVINLLWSDVETPTHCCRSSQCFCMLMFMSVCLLFAFTAYFIFSIPTIILVYYLYPTRTLLRLPLIINAVLYINSLLALLLFQCERCCFPFVFLRHVKVQSFTGYIVHSFMSCRHTHILPLTVPIGLRKLWTLIWGLTNAESIPFEERVTNLDYYVSEKKSCVTYFCHSIATLFVLISSIYLLSIISELLDLYSQSSNSNLNLLLILVPSLVLLFGSWYKFDVFFDIEKEKLMQKLKESGSPPSKQPESPGSPPEQPPGVFIQDQLAQYLFIKNVPSEPNAESDSSLTERSKLLQ